MSSCSILNKQATPNYTKDEDIRTDMVAHQPIPLGVDTTKTIIVYNVVEKENNKLKITDETIRLLIADFFGTITTIITVWQMQDQP